MELKEIIIKQKEFILYFIDVVMGEKEHAYLLGQLHCLESLLKEIEKYENKKV